ncbi:MAG: hypothetical protein WDW38_008472 [Sanguina aurantia]
MSTSKHKPVALLSQTRAAATCAAAPWTGVLSCSNVTRTRNRINSRHTCSSSSSSSGSSSSAQHSAQSIVALSTAWDSVCRRLPAIDCNGQSFDIIIAALKLALACLQGTPAGPDGRTPSVRAVQLASSLAELCASGLPLDAEAIAAGIIAEAAGEGLVHSSIISDRLGPNVAMLVHDVLRVRSAPGRVPMYDDGASSAIREWCLAVHDVRASVVEVVSRWNELRHMGRLPKHEQQSIAIVALQVHAPLGHALGLGPISAALEDLCFQALFPNSFQQTSHWLHQVLDPAEDALFACQQQLLALLDDHPRFKLLAAGCVVRARTKSLFSIMKKLLRLGDASAAGGRQVWQVYDLLGMRAIIQPRTDLAPLHAEAAAIEACYLVQELAQGIWPAIAEREKDYITHPKGNGYRSIHISLQLPGVPDSCTVDGSSSEGCSGGGGSSSSRGTGTAEGPGRGQARPYAYAEAPLPASWLEASSPGADSPFITPIVLHPPPHSTSSHAAASNNSTSASRQGSSCSDTSSSSSGGSSTYASFQPSSGPSGGQQRQTPNQDDTLLSGPCVELQIRTVSMDELAESGDAAHTAYKGGLDSRQSRQLQAWTRQLQARVYLQGGKGLLLAATAAISGNAGSSKASSRVVLTEDASPGSSSWALLNSDVSSSMDDVTPSESIISPAVAAVSAVVVLPLVVHGSHASIDEGTLHPRTSRTVLQPASLPAVSASGSRGSQSSGDSRPLDFQPSSPTGVPGFSLGDAPVTRSLPSIDTRHSLPAPPQTAHPAPAHNPGPPGESSETSIPSLSQSAHVTSAPTSPPSLSPQAGDGPATPPARSHPDPAASPAAASSTPHSRLFANLDRNNDGTLSLEELSLVLSELGAGGEAEARQLMALLDEDGDGIVTLQEFTELHRKVGPVSTQPRASGL